MRGNIYRDIGPILWSTPLASPHSRTQIVTQRTRKRTSVDTEWSGWTPRSWSKKSQERQEAPDWLERFAGFQKISGTQ